MQLEDLVVGVEYYTTNDETWATDQLGGRMRLKARTPDVDYVAEGHAQLFMPCDRLDPVTGHVIDRNATVCLDGFRGLWDPVGMAVLARVKQREADAVEADEADEEAAKTVLARLAAAGIPALITRDGNTRLIALSPAQIGQLLEQATGH